MNHECLTPYTPFFGVIYYEANCGPEIEKPNVDNEFRRGYD